MKWGVRNFGQYILLAVMDYPYLCVGLNTVLLAFCQSNCIGALIKINSQNTNIWKYGHYTLNTLNLFTYIYDGETRIVFNYNCNWNKRVCFSRYLQLLNLKQWMRKDSFPKVWHIEAIMIIARPLVLLILHYGFVILESLIWSWQFSNHIYIQCTSMLFTKLCTMKWHPDIFLPLLCH